MKPNTIAAIIALIGGLIQFTDWIPLPTPKPLVIADVLGDCHVADRASKIRLITEMAGRDFDSDSEQASWWNSETDAARQSDYRPFIDAVAEAIEAGTLTELAEGLTR
ncbi:MAG: hypothetical protein ABGZ17_32170 [Planctomycetaceae bacterium]